jgi:hypothetical protein
VPRPCLALVARQGGDFDFSWNRKSTSPPCRKRGDKDGAPESFGKGINQLQFKIKGQDYFLAFVEQERRWYVFAPTAQGVHRIPVYVDAEKYGAPAMLGNETTLSS